MIFGASEIKNNRLVGVRLRAYYFLSPKASLGKLQIAARA
jgi:hypothetical protein